MAASGSWLVDALIEERRGRGPLPRAGAGCLDEETLALIAEGAEPRRAWVRHLASCHRCSRVVSEVVSAFIRRPRAWWEAVARARPRPGEVMFLQGGVAVQSDRLVKRAARTYGRAAAGGTRRDITLPRLRMAAESTPSGGAELAICLVTGDGVLVGSVAAVAREGPRIERGAFKLRLDLPDRRWSGARAAVALRSGEGGYLVFGGWVRGAAVAVEGGAFGRVTAAVRDADIEAAIFARAGRP